MTTKYNIDSQTFGVNGFGRRFTDTSYTVTLGAATEATLTIPGNAALGIPSAYKKNKFIAVITCEQAKKVYFALNETAAVPAGATIAASTSALLPIQTAFFVEAGDVIHLISAAAADVSIELYAINSV